MSDRLIHSISLKLADRLNFYSKNEGKEYLKLVYGMEIVVINILSLTILFILSLIFGTLFQTIVILIGFNIIRRPASGIHAGSSVTCALSSTVLFIVAPLLLRDYGIDNLTVALIFIVIMLLLFLYAPADTESKPLVGKKKRARLRKRALISGILLMIVTLLINNNSIKALLTLGAAYEAAAILPVTYAIFNKKYRNYTDYEKNDLAVALPVLK